MAEDKPQSVTEFYEKHREKGGHDNDDALLQVVAERFCAEPPPKIVRVPVIPPGFKADPDIMEYERRRMGDPDFDIVRQRMMVELDEETAAEADNRHDIFVQEYDKTKFQLMNEREERMAAAKEEIAKVEASKKYYRSRMESKDPKVREQAEIDYLIKHVKL